ncbi:RNA polymerase sigma factor [Nocardioides baekrokdamisoli]|nr:RNA polymerase sigma factor [Nocardioides baekrokdamisoli]
MVDPQATPVGAGSVRDRDAGLLEAAQRGDSCAFGELWTLYESTARQVASAVTASDLVDDVVAEAFARVLTRMRRGHQIDHFRAYLLQVVRSVAVDHYRAVGSKVVPIGGGDEFEPLTQPWLPPEPADGTYARSAYLDLCKSDREIIRITVLEGARPAEVAQALGVTAGAAAVRAFRARERLRERWLVAHARAAESVECARQRARLGAYSRGNLGTARVIVLERHLACCDSCAAALDEVTWVNRTLRASVTLPVAAVLAGGSLAPKALFGSLAHAFARHSAVPFATRPLRIVSRHGWAHAASGGWLVPAAIVVTPAMIGALVLPVAPTRTESQSSAAVQPVAVRPKVMAHRTPAVVPPAPTHKSVPASAPTEVPTVRPVPVRPSSPAVVIPARPTPRPTPTATPTTGPNLVAQRRFNNPYVSNNVATFCSPTTAVTTCDGTSLAGWSVSGDSVDLNAAFYVPAPPGDPAGTQCVDLIGQDQNESGHDGLAQTFATVPGGTYMVKFAMAPDPRANVPTSSASIRVAGTDVANLTFDNTSASTASSQAMGWTTKVYRVVATSSSTTVEIFATNAGDGGPELTDVTFQRVG